MGKMAMWLFIALISMVISTPVVYADPVYVGDTIVLQNGPGDTNGGEFEVYKNGSYLFNTFCIEKDEYISFGTPFKVSNISVAAVEGGSGGPSPDPINPLTASLYYHFRQGDLLGYDYGAGRAASADALQIAIWFIEEELGSTDTIAELISLNPKAGDFYMLAQNDYKWADIGPVRAMNLTSLDGTVKKQDQLVLVPEPTTILLLGAGLLGLAFGVRLRKRK